MWYRLFLFLLFLPLCHLRAQIGDVYISLAMSSECSLDMGTRDILKNKFMQMVSAHGVAATEYGAIVLVPEVNVLQSSTINGGMRTIKTFELGITATVRNMITHTVFNTIQFSVKGEGYSETEAMRSAINKINPSSANYAQFVDLSKKKIIEYYTNNTAVIIAKANTLASMQQFDEALALLATYPESLSGYSQVASSMTKIFRQCQTQYCSQILLSAQAAYAQHRYDEAADLLALVDAQSTCAKDAQSLLKSIKSNLDKEQADAMKLEMESIASKERIRTAQCQAIKDIAVAFFKRQTNFQFF